LGRDSNEQNERFFIAVLACCQCAIEFANDVSAWHEKQKWRAKCRNSAGGNASVGKLVHGHKIKFTAKIWTTGNFGARGSNHVFGDA